MFLDVGCIYFSLELRESEETDRKKKKNHVEQMSVAPVKNFPG